MWPILEQLLSYYTIVQSWILLDDNWKIVLGILVAGLLTCHAVRTLLFFFWCGVLAVIWKSYEHWALIEPHIVYWYKQQLQHHAATQTNSTL